MSAHPDSSCGFQIFCALILRQEFQQLFVDELRVFKAGNMTCIGYQDQRATDQIRHVLRLGRRSWCVLLAAHDQRGMAIKVGESLQGITTAPMPMMKCVMECKMEADCMTCMMMPMPGMSMEMMNNCCMLMMKMMNDCAMPMMMSCNGMPMMCCTC